MNCHIFNFTLWEKMLYLLTDRTGRGALLKDGRVVSEEGELRWIVVPDGHVHHQGNGVGVQPV